MNRRHRIRVGGYAQVGSCQAMQVYYDINKRQGRDLMTSEFKHRTEVMGFSEVMWK